MTNCQKYRNSSFFCFAASLTHFCLSQTPLPDIQNSEFKKSNLAIEVVASILPDAKITRLEGNYELRSHLQSSYDLGINYLKYINKSLRLSTGFHFIVGKRNFFANIPSEDINNWDGRNIIENKELWEAFRIQLLLEKKFSSKTKKEFLIKGGINLRYSGFMIDESIAGFLVYSNTQVVRIFRAELSPRNNGNPWLTFLGGFSKSVLLNNQNSLSIGLNAEISPTYFIKGSYEITVPNKPITTGTYKINGAGLGLSVQYSFRSKK